MKCVEELSELSVEICKVCQMYFDESYEETAEDRNKFVNKFTITTSLALDEVADVWITLFQAIMILDNGAFVNRLNIKLDRLEELIKDKKEKKVGKKCDCEICKAIKTMVKNGIDEKSIDEWLNEGFLLEGKYHDAYLEYKQHLKKIRTKEDDETTC